MNNSEMINGVDRAVALRIRSPEKIGSGIELEGGPITIGRNAPDHMPDVALGPDAQRWVGRLHCTLDFSDGMWTVTDNASVNGTLLRHGNNTDWVEARAYRSDGGVETPVTGYRLNVCRQADPEVGR